MIKKIEHNIYSKSGELLLAKGYRIALTEDNRRRLKEFGVLDQVLGQGIDEKSEEINLSDMNFMKKTTEGCQVVLNPLVEKAIEKKDFFTNISLEETYCIVENLVYGHKNDNWYPYVATLVNYVDWVYSHSINTALVSCLIGSQIGYSITRLEELALGAFLHDVGMTLLPKSVLNKPDKLTEAEMVIVKNHCEMGYSMLADSGMSDVSKKIILQHHEKNDGSGYPNGLKENEIIEEARIVAIAEAFDTATTSRPYKEAKPVDKVLCELMMEKEEYENELVQTLVQIMK